MPRARVGKQSPFPPLGTRAAGAEGATGRGRRSALPAGADGELRNRLARQVRLARARRGMTRRQLARESGISLAYLARVENGAGNLSLDLLQRLAAAVNLPVPELLSPPEVHGADYALLVEFLKRRAPGELAHIRQRLFEEFEGRSQRAGQRIALTGIRGAGKSSIGPLLAEALGIPFVELNREIVREAGIALSEIFMLYGQSGYRALERRCLERVVTEYPRVVLATGGGIVAEPATYELLLSSFYTVWLHGRPEILFGRVMAQHDARIASPQLRSEALEHIARMLEARRHLYELADVTIDTSGKDVAGVLRELVACVPAAEAVGS